MYFLGEWGGKLNDRSSYAGVLCQPWPPFAVPEWLVGLFVCFSRIQFYSHAKNIKLIVTF